MAWTTPATWATDEVPGSAKLNAQLRDNLGFILPDNDSGVSYTPTLQGTTTNYDVSTVSGRQCRVGAIQFAWCRFILIGSAEQNGSGTMFVALPNASVGLDASGGLFAGQAIGEWHARDNSSPSDGRGGTVSLRGSASCQFQIAGGGIVNGTSPFTWDDGDILTFRVCYLIG